MALRHFLRVTLMMLVVCAPSGWLRADDRIRLDVGVGGKKEAFILDTGFGGTFGLYRPAASRIGLKFTPPPAGLADKSGQVLLGSTEPCPVTLLGRTEVVSLQVVDTPEGVATDGAGLVGWPVLSREIVRFQSVDGVERATIESALPRNLRRWLKVRVIRGQILTLDIPAVDGSSVRVDVDTGASSGVALPPEYFRAWRGAHPASPSTLEAYWLPAAGLQVREEAWADELNLGEMTLFDVPVDESATTGANVVSSHHSAVIGLAALRHLDLVVDGPNDVAYVRPSRTPAVPYNHNRLGAVFVPRDLQSRDLIARVLPGSPAEQAGVRTGDILLKIDALDVTTWQTQPGITPLSRFWTRPAGTELALTLQRKEATMVVPVTLQEILGPGSE